MSLQNYKFIKLNSEELWKKELRLILNRDIHENGLGCCVNNTHIKVGDVHLGKFYEAQFLFGNAYWISIFSNALKKEIINLNHNKDSSLLIVGYETYIEPVLLQLKDLLKKDYSLVDFCIYEEPKYISKDKKSNIRLRFGTNKTINDYNNVILVCGISSTLSTYYQIISKIAEEKGSTIEQEKQNINCCSIIQVLPTEFQNKDKQQYYFNALPQDNTDMLLYYSDDNIVSRNFVKNTSVNIDAKYLVEVFCEWQLAENCKWCFNEFLERPIITTNETSVIPVQMIGQTTHNQLSLNTTMDPTPKINFFETDINGDFIYSNFLYYNHIERDSHHFQYYIRTNALLKYIINNEAQNKKLDEFCEKVKENLFGSSNKNRIDVIIVPIHYSNEHFLNVIFQRVFDNCAEIINFDPQKEFRSNFETKFSNYAYVLETMKSENEATIYFHYLDDQIITGNTYYKAKSYVSSLIHNSIGSASTNDKKDQVKIFESIITLIDRNSTSTKSNYISDCNKFFSLIDIFIPSLRNHGDSCYLCKKSNTSEKNKQKSALWIMEKYWEEKQVYHQIKSLDEMKKLKKDESEEIALRRFRRFYCENLIWKSLKSNWNDDSKIYKELLRIIASELKKHKRIDQYEYLISFVKVISKPYLYYRENVKKAVHAFMIYFIHILNQNPHVTPSSILHILKNTSYGNHEQAYKEIDNYIENITPQQLCKNCYIQKYYLYVMLISRLCDINSNYLISYSNIEKALSFYDALFFDKKDAKHFNLKKISEYIAPLIKQVTNGISGTYKAKKLDNEIEHADIKSCHKEIIQRIYLENLEAEECISPEKNEYLEPNLSTRDKYTAILKKFSHVDNISLMIKFNNSQKTFMVASNEIHTDAPPHAKSIYTTLNKDLDFYIEYKKYIFIKCCDFDDGSKAYLIIKYTQSCSNDIFDVKMLKFIRSILTKRYELCNKLISDMSSGAINELYQDDKWIEMLAQPKAVSHGQSEDIKEHLKILEQKFALYKSHIDVLKQNFYDIVSELTLFGNLLISFFHSKKVADERGINYKFEKELIFTQITSINRAINISSSNDGLNFQNYDNNLTQEDLYNLFISRFNLYLKCMKNRGIFINLENEIKESVNGIISLDISDENLIWIPIAIIHILVRNAIQHGDSNGNIDIIFQRNNDHFDLVVKNKLSKKDLPSDKGITEKALMYTFKKSKINFQTQKSAKEYAVSISNFFNGETL